MNFWVHVVLAVLLTVLFLLQFVRQKQIYQLLFVIWVPSTLLVYIPAIGGNETWRMVLGGFQLLLFVLVIFFMFRRDPKKLAEARAAMKEEMTPSRKDASEKAAPLEEEDGEK